MKRVFFKKVYWGKGASQGMMVADEGLGRVGGWLPLWRCVRMIQELDGLRTATDWEAGGC